MNSMSIFVGFLALIFGVGGYATSIFALIIEWIFPLTMSKMPEMVERPAGRTSHPVVIVAHREAPIPVTVEPPSLRRHSSFHRPPVPMGDSAPSRPFYDRRVSFDLAPGKKFFRTHQRKNSSPLCAFKLRDFAEDSDSSRRSSPRSDSGTLVSDVHSSTSMTPLDLEIRPAFSTASSGMGSPRPSLGKRLPSLKNPFATMRRISSSSVSPIAAEFHPELRSEVLRSNLNQESPYFPSMPLPGTEARPRTPSTISGESQRSAFGLLMPNRAPKSPLADQQQAKNRAPSKRFPNPWPRNRGTAPRARTPSPPPDYTSGPSSPRRTFIGLFASSKPSSPLFEGSESTSYFSVNHTEPKLPKPVRRTQPYAPPYNAPMPSEASNGSDHGRAASDPVLADSKYIGRKLRHLKPKPAVAYPISHRPKWPAENMIEILDKKLSAAREAQIFEDGFQPPKYVWTDDDAASASRVPDVVRGSYAHSTSSHRRVQSESWGRGRK